MRKLSKLAALLSVLALLLAACTGDGASNTTETSAVATTTADGTDTTADATETTASTDTGATPGEDSCEGLEPHTIYYATHAFAHPFFAVMERGAEEGARAACLELTWTQDSEFSIEETINRMEAGVAAQPDLMVVALADPDAMRATLERAADAGIPVIAVNAADPAPPGEQVPHLLYIGADEYTGGVAAARIALANGAANGGVCFNHQPGQLTLETRCAGWTDTLAEAGISSENIDISGGATEAEAAADAYFLANPEVDAALALGPGPAEIGAVLNVIANQGLDVSVVSFDLGDIALAGIQDGSLLAAIDQQQYLQGYLPAIVARGYLDWGLLPGADILTGPGIVDATNIDLVLAGIEAGTR